MKSPRFRLNLFHSDSRGATLVEFGFVALPLSVLLMGLFDLGYQTYLNAVTKGVLEQAARSASVGTVTGDELDSYIEDKMDDINTDHGTTSVIKKSYYNFSNVGKPEKITGDTVPLGSYNEGDCFEDANGNGNYDTDTGETGIGGADDVVFYEVTISLPRLFPMAGLLGWSETQSSTAKTAIRNQPWGNQATPEEVCD
ncbi:TadE/TadG family type IV pilus assembly protein [Rhizorhapis suberifaciens]|uniref:Flp pilus assembly protein TadG n=1 Tax=Rhizorhapis suberifaciens TaxID=13656 RepID=A0A840HQ56_9SPHN|nr:TadE/TadG family type IV pilus assembly protein [Rhizorhapis suberifaciens]MBB4640055.1 Flp pilus assembly protein TadG [Rhizorhapis suberifaciens]